MFIDAGIYSASYYNQNDTIIESVELLWNKLLIITNKGGFLVGGYGGLAVVPGTRVIEATYDPTRRSTFVFAPKKGLKVSKSVQD